MGEIRSSFNGRKRTPTRNSSASSSQHLMPTTTRTASRSKPSSIYSHSSELDESVPMGHYEKGNQEAQGSTRSLSQSYKSSNDRSFDDNDQEKSTPDREASQSFYDPQYEDITLNGHIKIEDPGALLYDHGDDNDYNDGNNNNNNINDNNDDDDYDNDEHNRESTFDPSFSLWPDTSSLMNSTTVFKPQIESLRDSMLRSMATSRPSGLFSNRNANSNDDPMHYLLMEEKWLNKKLNDLIQSHSTISKKGGNVKSIRRKIAICFKDLGLTYQAMAELYEKQMIRRQAIHSSFEEWEQSKRELKAQIADIRSQYNEEGQKLNQLLQETKVVDDEIESLEKRLNQLKDKKGVLNHEITQVQSIIDSRASSHIENLENIEQEEKLAIMRLSEEKSIITQFSNLALNNDIQKQSVLGSFLMRFAPQPQTSSIEHYDPLQVMEMFERQIETLEDGIKDYKNKENVYNESLVIWENTSDILGDLEKDLAVILKSQTSETSHLTTEKIILLLQKTCDILNERVGSIKNMNDVLKSLYMIEISTLQTGIEMLSPKKPNITTFNDSKVPKKLQSPQPSINNKPLGTVTVIQPTLSTSPPESSLGKGSADNNKTSSLNSRLKDNLTGKNRSSNNSSSTDVKQGKND